MEFRVPTHAPSTPITLSCHFHCHMIHCRWRKCISVPKKGSVVLHGERYEVSSLALNSVRAAYFSPCSLTGDRLRRRLSCIFAESLNGSSSFTAATVVVGRSFPAFSFVFSPSRFPFCALSHSSVGASRAFLLAQSSGCGFRFFSLASRAPGSSPLLQNTLHIFVTPGFLYSRRIILPGLAVCLRRVERSVWGFLVAFSSSCECFCCEPGGKVMEGLMENGANRAVDSVKLFVGQLPKQMSEQQLAEVFSEAGTVYEINIIKDKLTKQSRGCCFLTYTTRQEADKAIEIFHNKRILQPVASALQMKYADGEMERLEHKLFIGMLPKGASKADVMAVFSPYGAIKELSVIKGSQPTSKGCAFLKYETKEQAIAAIEALNGVHKMEGSPSALVVKWADTEKERQARKVQKAQAGSPPIPGQQPSIFGAVPMGYVTGPPPYNGYPYQPMNNYALPYPQQSGMVGLPTAIPGTQPDLSAYPPMQPAAYAFGAQQYPVPYQGQMMGHQGQSYPSPLSPSLIGMNTVQAAAAAAAAAVRTSVGPQTEGPAGANLFIYHIPPEFGDQELSTAFSSFGNVISAKVFVDKTTGASKCFGFVSYDTPEAAQAAINVMNGFQLSGKRLKVQLKRDTKQSKPY